MNTILLGDALEQLRQLPDNLVQTCVTSPPYFSLRDYGVPGQIGLEATPDEYIAKLVEVFREVKRILRDDGTCWINIGDTYAAGKAGRTDYGTGDPTSTLGPQRNGLPNNSRPGAVIQRSAPAGYKPKDLIGVPWMLAFALRSDGWYLRSEIIWAKGNPMPESVEDRPTRSHEHIFLLAKSERYYYDHEAIKEPLERPEEFSRKTPARFGGAFKHDGYGTRLHSGNAYTNVLTGRNKRDVWHVNPAPYPESHFAVFPPKLIEPMILSSSSPGDIVLDCFMGAGTTALVALQHGRQYLGVELNPAYVALAEKRIALVQQNLWTAAWEESEVGA